MIQLPLLKVGADVGAYCSPWEHDEADAARESVIVVRGEVVGEELLLLHRSRSGHDGTALVPWSRCCFGENYYEYGPSFYPAYFVFCPLLCDSPKKNKMYREDL